MSFAATAAVVGAGSAIYLGAQQRKAADRRRRDAVDPGIQRNFSLDRVTNTLFENYSNWSLPGYSKMSDQINTSQATADNAAIQASTSSADVLNSITNNQAVATNALNDLGLMEASGKEQALMRYLDSVNQQGQDQIRVNNAELGRYDSTLREAAALEGASIQNQNSGFQDVLTAGAAIAGNFSPRTSIDPNTGKVIKLPSAFQTLYGKRKSNFTALPGAQF